MLKELKVGESVFVPCLDTAGVREYGLKLVLPLRYSLKASPAICRGCIGVLFTRSR